MLLKDLAQPLPHTAPRQPGSPVGVQHRHSRARSEAATTLALMVLDPLSVLSNAADEMSQSLSSKVQERSLRERRVSVGSGIDEMSRERLLTILRHLQSGHGGGESAADPAKLLELARRILKQPGAARQLVREQGGDPSSQYLTLLEVAELIQSGQAGPDPAAVGLEAVREAAEHLMAEHGDFIRADLNTIDFSSSLGAPEKAAAFRTAYRDTVLASETLAQSLQHLLRVVDDGSGGDFDKVLEATKAALGADLAAARSSAEPVRLQYLVSDLSHLKVISTVVDQCAKLGKTLGDRHGLAGFKASGLASDLVSISNERWVDASRFDRLADRYGAKINSSCTVDFLSGARDSLRQLPPQVFPTMESRQSLLDTAQLAIDDAVGREEMG